MKITAIRLAEVGRFREPVAIERLSGGLDVLSGPNEAGKSTLFTALGVALFEKHGSRRKEIEALRPYAGGAPTVEVELQADGRQWRLRKRFLAQPSADLYDLTGGGIARGADAEEQLARLVGGPGGDGRFGLLWVGQRGTLNPFQPAAIEGAGAALEQALAREISAVASGELARHVRADVRRCLEIYLTVHAQPRPRGPYAAALKAAEEHRQSLGAARDELARAMSRLDQLASLARRRGDLADPGETAKRQSLAARAREALEAARNAVTRRDLAAAALATSESQAANLRQSVRQMEEAARELAEIDASVLARERERREAERNLASQNAAHQAMRALAEANKNRLTALEAEHASAIAAERTDEAKQRLDQLVRREAGAREAAAQHGALAAELAKIRAEPAVLAPAREAVTAIREHEARLAAAAPSIAIAYLPGAQPRMRIAGRPLADGERLTAVEPIEIDIEGVGRITVSPGGGAGIDAARGEIAIRRQSLAQIFAGAGVSDLAALEAAVERRRTLEAGMGAASARLASLAPDGYGNLTAALDETRRAVEAAPTHEGRARAVVAADIAAARREIATLERELTGKAAAIAATREGLARLGAAASAASQRRTALLAGLPEGGLHSAQAQALIASLAEAQIRLNAAVRDHAAWAEAAPDAKSLADLEAARAASDAAVRAAERDLVAIDADMARIEGELTAARHDDAFGRVAALEDEAARADAHAMRLTDEVASLQLIEAELATAEASARDRYLAPVLQRLQPLLAAVIPGAEARLAGDLAPDGLVRGGRHEALARLSAGTQEQLAILVRLAFGRLFADTGAEVPVILDDALVYADDARVARMFEALAEAAKRHQVIVLSCRETAFAGLAGNRLQLEPWAKPAL